jgi:hypothetical protein
METLGDLVGLVGSAVSGGLVGVAGFGLKALFAWLNTKAEMQKMQLQFDQEYRLQQLAQQGREREMENEREIAAEETRQRSYDFMPIKQEVWRWVASINSLMRPTITMFFMFLTTALTIRLIWGGPIPYVNTHALIKELVALTVFLTASSVTWWFGDRPPQKRGDR